MTVDPRLADAGLRLVLPENKADDLFKSNGLNAASFDQWDHHRLSLGLPDGARDMEVEHTLLLEAGFEELSGVDFKKGCYVGQENTARTKHRKLLKRRLVHVHIAGEIPAPGTPVLLDDHEIGQMRSANKSIGLAFIRLENLQAAQLVFSCGSAQLTAYLPQWLQLEQP